MMKSTIGLSVLSQPKMLFLSHIGNTYAAREIFELRSKYKHVCLNKLFTCKSMFELMNTMFI